MPLNIFPTFIFMLWWKNGTTSEHVGSLIHIPKKVETSRLSSAQSVKHVRNTVYKVREIHLMSVMGRWCVVPLVGQRQQRPLLLLSKVHNDDDTEQHKVQEKPRAQRLSRSKFLQPIITRSKSKFPSKSWPLINPSECAGWCEWRWIGLRLKLDVGLAPPTEREACFQPAAQSTPTEIQLKW